MADRVRPSPALDSFVTSTARPDHEVGRLVAVDEELGTAELAFFVAPGCDLVECTAPLASIRSAPLVRQTRVYVPDPDGQGWMTGRVLEDGEVPARALDREAFPEAPRDGNVYVVRFPGRLDVALGPRELEVRWGMAVGDPVDWLAACASEGPFLYQRRSNILREILRQRAQYRGLNSLASASVELLEHQVRTVRRVLEDPVRRYVLADEIGLGKTIEAGLILRQHLLDRDESGLGLIVVPTHLKEQWYSELTGTLALSSHCFELVSPDELAEALELLSRDPSMLIVDEAHHTSRYAYSPESSDKQAFAALEKAAAIAVDVLLLSATPVLRNEAGFLAMLHLLDPEIYGLEDLEEFRGFIAKRDQVALILDDLDGPLDDAFLEEALSAAEEVIHGDPRAAGLIEDLRSVLEQDLDEERKHGAVDRLRIHIRETHRFHNRFIRARRTESQIRDLLPSRSHELLEYSDPLRNEANTLLDEWRFRVLEASQDDTNPELASLFGRWLDAMLEHPKRLAAAWRDRARVLSFLTNGEVFQEEKVFLLDGAEQLDRDDDAQFRTILSAIRSQLTNRDSKVTVFLSDPAHADGLVRGLSGRIPGRPVRFTPGDQSPLQAFLSDTSTSVLVVDRESEEGLNLQGVPATIVHADLPCSPMRVEQRIGRLDRIGATSMRVHSVIPHSRDGYEHAVVNLMSAIGVFGASVAPLQFLLEELHSWITERLLDHGTDTLRDAIDIIATEGHKLCLDDELRKIRRQYLIDAAGYLAPDRSYYSILEDYEYGGEVEGFAKALREWLGMGALGLVRLSARGDKVFRYQYSARSGQLPRRNFVSFFARTIDRGFRSGRARPTTRPMTLDRITAESKRVPLARIGHPLVDAVERQIRLDERGMSFAVWRETESVDPADDPHVYLRFDFLVEAAVAPTAAYERRRVDALFDPTHESVWLDPLLVPVDDEEVLRLLDVRTPARATDTTLRAGETWHSALASFPTDWADWCRQGSEIAEAKVRNDPSLEKRIRRALKQIGNDLLAAEAILEARAQRMRRDLSRAELEEVEAHRSLASRLREAIENTTVRRMFAGAIFLSGHSLGDHRRNDSA